MGRNGSSGNYSDESEYRRVGFFRQLSRLAVFLAITPAVLVTAGLYRDGKSVAEKVATAVLSPVGLIVFVLIGVGLYSFRNSRWSIGAGLLLLAAMAWLGTSPLVATWIMDELESNVESLYPSADNPLDYLVVLGGGTGMTPDLRPQLGEAGDRVGLAIRLYHAGAVRKIVVTGTKLPGKEDPFSQDPCLQSKQLLVESNVDESNVSMIDGINTTEEMRSLKSQPEYWQGKRCGLVTSAFHLPRAMRLAKAQGLDLIPVAADYRGNRTAFDVRQLMPSADASRTIELAVKEYLGMLIGR